MHKNNNGLFRRQNSSDSPLSIHYRGQTARLKHRRIKRKLLNGAGDLQCTPSPSTQSKQIDFTELEEIFDTAIRKHLPIDLYKSEKSFKTPIETNRDEHFVRQPSIPFQYPQSETRLNLIVPPSISKPSSSSFLKKHRILSAVIFVTFAALVGFFTVFIFLK